MRYTPGEVVRVRTKALPSKAEASEGMAVLYPHRCMTPRRAPGKVEPTRRWRHRHVRRNGLMTFAETKKSAPGDARNQYMAIEQIKTPGSGFGAARGPQ